MGAAGYSGTPLAAKLGISAGCTLVLLHAPSGVLEGLPPGVVVRHRAGGRADVVVAFFTERSRFERRVAALGKLIFPAGGLWIAWPKRASRVETDLTDHVVRESALPRAWWTTRCAPLTPPGPGCGWSGGASSGSREAYGAAQLCA